LLDFVAKYEETTSLALIFDGNPVPLLTINNWILLQKKVIGGAPSFHK